jgi:exopolyphosphatase / guanosine-5'-triphosphate,3'-diphosphate pyrophosphatase
MGNDSPHSVLAQETRDAQETRGGPLRYRPPMTYAALDLGTNNCRLLVARPQAHGFRVIDAFSRIVRLGEGLGATGRLGEEAMARAIEALKVCADKIALRQATRTRLIATEACRAASNGTEFIAEVARQTGIGLDIIDQRTEAMLAVTGCAALAAPDAESVIVFDIGGGSTEVIWLDGAADSQQADQQVPGHDLTHRIRAWQSLPIGVVSVAERHGGVHVSRAEFEHMVEESAAALADFATRAAPAKAARGFHLLGTSGTVTTVAGIHLGLERYDRRQVDGLWMQEHEVVTVMNRLIDTSYEDRARNACIGHDRADLVLAGCAIYEAIRRAFPSPRIRIADRGLREGLLLRMMHEDKAWADRPA